MRWDRPQRPEEGDRPHETGVSDVPILHTPEDKKVRVPWSELYLSPEDEATSPERTPPDRGRDAERPEEPGSWRGDGGQYLNHEENLVTDHAIDRIHTAEPQITDTLRTIAADLPEAELVGLESRLKGEDRIKEKVTGYIGALRDREAHEVIDEIHDSVRYTYQFDGDGYVEGYHAVRNQLEDRGYAMITSRNLWDDPEYKGINTRWVTPDGQLFEVQFHTPESFDAKQLTHDAYKRIRSSATSEEDRAEAAAFQQRVSADIPVPPGVGSVADFTREEY